jgi:hypothetical protein
MSDAQAEENKKEKAESEVKLNTPIAEIKLARTAEAIDRIFSAPLGRIAEKVESMFDKNAASHITAIKRHRIKKIEFDPINIENIGASGFASFTESLRDASHFDETSDPELSTAWRMALNSILNNNNNSDDIINFLKDTPRGTLRTFFRQYADGLNSDQSDAVTLSKHSKYHNDLINAGVLYTPSPVPLFIFVGVAILPIFAFRDQLIMLIETKTGIILTTEAIFINLIIIFMCMLMGYILISRPKLTNFGHLILSQYVDMKRSI